jgi:hypothetical protein
MKAKYLGDGGRRCNTRAAAAGLEFADDPAGDVRHVGYGLLGEIQCQPTISERTRESDGRTSGFLTASWATP